MNEQKQEKEYEQMTFISAPASWIILILFSAIILSWGMFAEMIVAVEEPHWNFGQLTDTPAQSIYSTSEPPEMSSMPTYYYTPESLETTSIPYQIHRIPDANLPPGEIKQ